MDLTQRHPGTVSLLRNFRYDHLPAHLQLVSRPIGELALLLTGRLSDGPELTAGLRKLVEAKDCLVRQAIADGEDVDPDRDRWLTQVDHPDDVHPAEAEELDRWATSDQRPGRQWDPRRGEWIAGSPPAAASRLATEHLIYDWKCEQYDQALVDQNGVPSWARARDCIPCAQKRGQAQL